MLGRYAATKTEMTQIIGNLFANVEPPTNEEIEGYKDYIKERLQLKFYGRYMDDFYIISSSKEELKDVRRGGNRPETSGTILPKLEKSRKARRLLLSYRKNGQVF